MCDNIWYRIEVRICRSIGNSSVDANERIKHCGIHVVSDIFYYESNFENYHKALYEVLRENKIEYSFHAFDVKLTNFALYELEPVYKVVSIIFPIIKGTSNAVLLKMFIDDIQTTPLET